MDADFIKQKPPRLPAGHHPVGNIHIRHRKLPTGFKVYKRGSGVPCAPADQVELMIRTAQGFGSSGVRTALYLDWDMGEKDGLGEVVGYRVVRKMRA